jgi:ABC-type tungstate transport system substrate-binding protein
MGGFGDSVASALALLLTADVQLLRIVALSLAVSGTA